MKLFILVILHLYFLIAMNTCADSAVGKSAGEPKSITPPNFIFEKWTAVSPEMKAPISNDSAMAAGRIQDKYPAFRDSSGVAIEGYFFNAADFAMITKIPNVSSLYFKMGISNFGDSVAIGAGRVKPKYTILVYPLDKDQKKIVDAAGNAIAFDYVCPCPAISTCCPRR